MRKRAERPSTRAALLGSVFFVCLMASSVLVTASRIPPADSQTYMPYWDPKTVEVLESKGEVVLTLRKSGPGHVRYQMENNEARAPDDFGAVEGHVIFTSGGSESKTITVPIVNDNVHEGSESFSALAHEGDHRAGGWTGSVGTVWILDDDAPTRSSGGSTSSGRSNPQQPAGPQPGSPRRPDPPSETIPPSSGSMVADNPTGVISPAEPTPAREADTPQGSRPLAANRGQEDGFPVAPSLGALLLGAIVAAGFALKRRLGHQTT